MASLTGDGKEAIRLMAEALDQGYWYTALYWDDADFNAIHDDDDFKRLRTVSEERAAIAQAAAKPELTVITPSAGATPYPVLLALHGNNSTAAGQGYNWSPATQAGWLVGLAQSSQIAGPNAYVWNNQERTDTEVKDHSATLLAQGGDPEQVVIGGFSMGGEAAIRLALTGGVPARGFVAVGPGGPLTNQNSDDWEPIIVQGRERGVRGYLVVGKQDGGYEQITKLIERLHKAGIPLQVEEHDELGHEFPNDFAARLPEILRFVLGD
jgi:pimeloyl-ACP methyl ester carboxylesterase